MGIKKIIIMSRFANFSEFKKIKPLLERADSEDLIELNYIIGDADDSDHVKEGFFDDLKTGASKMLFGSFSKAGMVDDLRKKLLDLEIKYYDSKFILSDEIDSINDEIEEARREKKEPVISALTRQLAAKEDERKALEGSHKANVKRVYDLLDKLIAKSSRIRDYWETGRAEDEYKLEKAKYEVLKNRSADAERLAKQKVAIEKAKAEAEKVAEEMKREMEKKSEEKEGEKKPKSKSTIDADSEKKIMASKKPKSIIQRKKELGVQIANLKADLEEVLEKAKNRIVKGKATEKNLEAYQREALEIAADLDSKVNLLNLYKNMGKNEEEIAKNSSKDSKITELTNKINQAITSGNESSTGTKKDVTNAFSGGATAEKIDKAASEIAMVFL
jgi:DNA repair exonuclease SbcCD ATPase subunit